jgi:hypothetical protein
VHRAFNHSFPAESVRAKVPIPLDERMFRKLRHHHRNGSSVLPEAVDLRGTSCDRAAFREASDLLTEEWPAIAFIVPQDLPTNIRPTATSATNAPTWDFFAVDLPEPQNEAHCEIRIRRTGRASDDNDDAAGKRPPIVREELKLALARKLRVLPHTWTKRA